MKIDIDKIKILFLSYFYFSDNEKNNKEKIEEKYFNPYEYNYLLKNKEIEKLELIQQTKDYNQKAHFICDKNKFIIEMEITNKKLNDFQKQFENERKELFPDDRKRIRITSTPKIIIYFNLSDIEFMFYRANFAAIVNNDETSELYIYLKKFNFECQISRQNYDKKEIKKYFPLFPDIDIDNIVNNLKFHDVVFCFNLKLQDLFGIMFTYEAKFKIVKNIIIRKINIDGNEEKYNNNDEEEDEEGNYDVNIPLDINNHDLIWHLLSLVSEHFITYYSLIIFLNKFSQQIKELIELDEFLFIVLLRDILKTKYTLSKTKFKFFNMDCFYNYIKNNWDKKLNDKQKKEYDLIKNIYTNDELRSKYYKYNLIITPITCEFKIPFLKQGIFLNDKFKNEFKSYDLIYIIFQQYRKISNNDIGIDTDISKLFLFHIISNTQQLFNLNYEYLGTTEDDLKHQKILFLNEEKISMFEREKSKFNNKNINNSFFRNEILFNEDIAAYACKYKSIKSVYKVVDNNNINKKINRGIISLTLKEKIKEECKIKNFSSCYGIIGDFSGNFSILDSAKLNYKNRIVIKQAINNNYKGQNKLLKDRILYILNISKFNPGILDNQTIDLLNCINSEKIIKTIIKDILNLKIENIEHRTPILKLKFFFNIIKNCKIKENNEFIFEIKKAFLKYQYNLISNNILDLPDSAILKGIFDEYNIMKKIKDEKKYVCVIIDNERNGGIKYMKGNGIIFKVNINTINSNNENKICKVKFLDLEKYEKFYENTKKYEKIQKMKKLKNVIIFPKNSETLIKELNIENISQQDFFISWNKDIIDNIDLKRNKYLKINQISLDDDLRKVAQNLFPKYIKNNNKIFFMHSESNKIFYKEYEVLLKNKVKYIFDIDYKNLTFNLTNKKYLKLNELELFYLEYIPKCTLFIKNIINKIKELMQIYSVNNIIELLIGNINIQKDTKKYINEIDDINKILLDSFNENLKKLISEFIYLKHQKSETTIYLSLYKERMFIITIIIFNICNCPNKVETIIRNFNKIIEKLIKHKMKTNEDNFNENNSNIQIKDIFDNNVDKFGVEYYLLFESDTLTDEIMKKSINDNINYANNNEQDEYKDFFEDFQIILFNQKEIKKFYIPELLLYKYLRQLNIDYI